MQSGVPQGSVLGPILFLLFVNDMPLFINEAYVDIYADDSTLHTAGKKLETVEETLQKGSEGFKTWCLSNGMYINIGKTSVMTDTAVLSSKFPFYIITYRVYKDIPL